MNRKCYHSRVLRMGSTIKAIREGVGLGLGTEGSGRRTCLWADHWIRLAGVCRVLLEDKTKVMAR